MLFSLNNNLFEFKNKTNYFKTGYLEKINDVFYNKKAWNFSRLFLL